MTGEGRAQVRKWSLPLWRLMNRPPMRGMPGAYRVPLLDEALVILAGAMESSGSMREPPIRPCASLKPASCT